MLRKTNRYKFAEKKYLLICIASLAFFCGCKSKKHWLEDELYPAVFMESGAKKVTSVNPGEVGFPGGRGPDHLVVYTSSFGQQTGTNEWGTEAVIESGRVTSVGGNNSQIPAGGMVISGNENASHWISRNLKEGMEVELKGDSLYYSLTENAFLLQARSLYKKVLARIESGKMKDTQSLPECEKMVAADYASMLNQKKQGNAEKAVEYSKQLYNRILKLYYSSFEPQANEFRGAWIRLADKSEDELKNTIKRMADAGINAILPETIYDGYAIYPNAHPLLPQLPQFAGWDPMQIMIEECGKYGIQVIPWCEMFFIGGAESPLVKQKPEWLGMFRHGTIEAELEPGFHYFCPSRPEVSAFLLETVDTLLRRYSAIKEVQLDYIRYSLSEPWEKGFCYCDYCRSNVRRQLNFDIMTISPENKREWEQWNMYRANNITGFVTKVNELLDQKYAGVQLSVDVVPHPEASLKYKFQDWGTWVKNGQVDAVYIMSYAFDNQIVSADAESLKRIAEGNAIRPIVGLGPYMGYTPETLLEQIEISRESGAAGVCLFSFNALSKDQIEALKCGPFRK
ncbi:MAG: family 10 glycosylhydrolase [Prolixibacteraceae bacterium]|nr:family 10 glycosylhydrolase [Prolixibacteraceae bacterium]